MSFVTGAVYRIHFSFCCRNLVYNLTLVELEEQQRLTWYSNENDANMCVVKGKDEVSAKYPPLKRKLSMTARRRDVICFSRRLRRMKSERPPSRIYKLLAYNPDVSAINLKKCLGRHVGRMLDVYLKLFSEMKYILSK